MKISIFILVIALLGYSAAFEKKVGPSTSPSVTPSASPVPIPRRLTGRQYLTQNGTLDPSYRFTGDQYFLVQINVENFVQGPIYANYIDYYSAALVSSYSKNGNHYCFQLGMVSYNARLSGCKAHEYYGQMHESCIKSGSPINLGNKHTYVYSYNMVDHSVYQDGNMLAQSASNEIIYACDAWAAPLTVGASFNESGGPDYFGNGDFYWLKIYRIIYNVLTLVGHFDFTERYYGTNNRTEFPNLVPGKNDTLYFIQA